MLGLPLPLLVAVPTVVLLVFWASWRWRNRRLLELAVHMPGPPALPVLGNALLFMASPNDQLKLIGDILKQYGQYVRFWLGPELNIVVSNPDDIKLLLTSNKVNQKGPVYEYLKPSIGPGILSGGSVWRSHRKIVTPSYNKKTVHHFATVFNAEATALGDVLSKKDPTETFNVYYDVVNCTTQCVCQTLMGLSKEESQNLDGLEELVLKTQSMYGWVFARMTKWWLHVPFIFWMSSWKRKIVHFNGLINHVCGQMVKKRKDALAKNETVEETARGIIDRLILSRELTDQEIRWETFTLFTTSQEASAKITSAVFLFLAHLPEWQEKVFDEIMDHLGPDDKFVTEEQLKLLRNLDMVYKEVLRYLSIAAIIQRTVQEEVTIDSGRITLPVGTSLVIPIHILHRDPRFWEESDKIKPERFSPENVKRRDRNAFVPFSLGAMDCLGRVYATTMIKSLAVRVLRRVRFEADGCLERLRIEVAISTKFADGYNLRAHPRKPRRARTHTVA